MIAKHNPEEDTIPYEEFYADLFFENVEDHRSVFVSLENLLTDKETIAVHVDKEIKNRVSNSKSEVDDDLSMKQLKHGKEPCLGKQ